MNRLIRLLAPELSLMQLWLRSPLTQEAGHGTLAQTAHMPAAQPLEVVRKPATPAAQAPSIGSARDVAWSKGTGVLKKLQGSGMRYVESELALLRANPRRPIGEARVFVIYGPPGTGRHTLGKIVGDLLYGAGVTGSAQVSRLADQSELAPNGTWLLENSEKFLSDESFMEQIGRQLMHANVSNPMSVALVLIGGERDRMMELMPSWVGKQETYAWPLATLTKAELLIIARNKLADGGMEISEDALAALGERLEKPTEVHHLKHASPTTLLVNYLSAATKNATRDGRSIVEKSDIPL